MKRVDIFFFWKDGSFAINSRKGSILTFGLGTVYTSYPVSLSG